MKLLALAAVLLVFLICPNVEGQRVARVSVAFSLSWDSLMNGMKDDVKKMEVKIKTLEGKAKTDTQSLVDKMKDLFQKGEQYNLQGLTFQELLKQVDELLEKVNNYLSQEYAELKAEATKLQEGLIIVGEKLLLKSLTQILQEVIQMQERTTSFQGELKKEAEDLLTWLEALMEKETALTIGELTKIQEEIKVFSQKIGTATPEVFEEINKFLQTVIEAIEQQISRQIQEYLNQVQAYVINLEGEAKERAEALITQLKAAIKNGEAISIQLLTNMKNGLQEISESVDTTIAEDFKKIIAGLQAIIESLQPSQQ